MKKLFNGMLGVICAVALVGCGEHGQVSSDKEEALQKVMKPYVENTVIATYSAMASEGLTLLDECEKIQDAVEKGNDYTDLMKQAGETWRRMRKHWEQSEAFLFGPAAKHNIDPHIDSWPLDYNAMNALLNNAEQMKQIEEEGGSYVGDKLGYALKGFHAAEYLLFKEGKPHATNLTKAEAVYLVGIVEDLAQQAILLEDSWAGGVSKEKEAAISECEKNEDGEEECESMSYEENYSSYFVNAGKAGSIYVTYQEAAEEIVAGCIDIAGEVADLKLGNPYKSSTPEQQEYIESPYSYTSTIDFADNIRSIQNSYAGAKKGDASISDWVKKQDKDLDAKVLAAIETAISEIEKIENFETEAKNNAQVNAAIEAVGELEGILRKEVLPLLSK